MDERKNEHVEIMRQLKKGGEGRRGEVNKQRLMVPDIFPGH